jgi:hydroxymethylbilane synthase
VDRRIRRAAGEGRCRRDSAQFERYGTPPIPMPNNFHDQRTHDSKTDMPTTLPPGLILGAVLEREDPRDALVLRPNSPYTSAARSATEILNSLPKDSLIGTSSLRRTAQLKRLYPHLQFASVRGNVPTRVQKLDDPAAFPDQIVPNYTALVLAAAGLIRLGLGARISAFLSSRNGEGGVLHAVGQGAVGVETRAGDESIARILGDLCHPHTWWACLAERALMRALEGGCSVPIGVETEWVDDGTEAQRAGLLRLRGIVVSLDGDEAVEAQEAVSVSTDEEAEALGRKVADGLVEKGADRILAAINRGREKEQEALKTEYQAVHHDGVQVDRAAPL